MPGMRTALLASECLIPFLTSRYLARKWTVLERRAFRDMMEMDKRRKILPLISEVSVSDCESIKKKKTSEKLKRDVGECADNKKLIGVFDKSYE